MRPAKAARAAAFTLVEVVLAILIISAIMTVLLYFYQRAVEVRQLVLEEVEFLSVDRMFMEQISGELRSARVIEDQFIGLEGSSNSISFVCTSIPQTARWITSTNETVVLPPVTDLKRVTYRLLSGTNVLAITGVDRTEEVLTGAAFTAGTNATEFVNAAGTNVISETSADLIGTNEVQLIRRPLTDRIKLLQFRYWAGTNWVDAWSGLDLPGGVEITLGKEPMPAEASSGSSGTGSAEQYPFEMYRRVVFLPNSVPPANRVPLEADADTLF
ncbi:MAG TPA: hypothetical protein VK633_08845 [Verrucomicrobiae bacterium]|nr:hypothetical protein [Verrucomicrobiae bacterium]